MVFYSILQSLRCAAYVPTITFSTKFEKQCKIAVSSCFGAEKLWVVFSTRKMFPTVSKMLCLLSNKVWSFINTCAAVILFVRSITFRKPTMCVNYDNKRFSNPRHSKQLFPPNLAEAVYNKTQRLVLCRRKEFVYTLKRLP